MGVYVVVGTLVIIIDEKVNGVAVGEEEGNSIEAILAALSEAAGRLI